MPYTSLNSFIKRLNKENELITINRFADPELEITEITDRVVKSNGKALLFTNDGTGFPVLINMFGSDKRMALALSRENPYDAGEEIEGLFSRFSSLKPSFTSKLKSLPELFELSSLLPSHSNKRGACQDVIIRDPDLGILPILKCWPYDGGRFITLPMVHTIHPETGSPNVGMYRMQVLDSRTTGMHWQRHKTGANHFEAWEKKGRRMPVSVTLGGDPVYTYAATAPLPENISEYILAGFLRKKRVRLVRCITNDLMVPEDADIVIEGYVDPSEELFMEGPFGDHTGFYSLSDLYPRFHVTCITHQEEAVYPATIVGIPPMEDAWLAKATERIFLGPVRMAMLPEVLDFHMPDAGTAHNLVIVSIRKSYPGQGIKVINSLFGAGQMMFSKYIVVVDGGVDIRNYYELARHVFINTDPVKDILFSRGPLDVLDHASDSFSFGGKAGIDATSKMPEEFSGVTRSKLNSAEQDFSFISGSSVIKDFNSELIKDGIPVLILSVDLVSDPESTGKLKELLSGRLSDTAVKLVVAVDNAVDVRDYFTVAWQVLANSDPGRDHFFINGEVVFVDGTIKAYRKGGFPRRWPNVVCSDNKTMSGVDSLWPELGIGEFIESPSLRYRKLKKAGNDELLTGRAMV